MSYSEILVHTCCGPCFAGVYPELKDKFAVSSYFYNPNIHPWSEFRLRLMTAGFAALHFGVKFFYDRNYSVKKWLEKVPATGERCIACVGMRLKKTAEFAKERNFGFFTTTLLVSPYQKHDEIKKIGFELAKKFGIEFYYEDFRKNYSDSIKISKELFLYRQKYCGCIFSEEEAARQREMPRRAR
ncbi:MAG: epoxyqueuosine reductase QueH [Elusimicrobia bacterium]|nr:epoxyqueuosine reductase QueH [Elusimicrobiota bacterium]